jgi:hypothetical protein
MMRRGSAAILALTLVATVVPAGRDHHRKHRDRQEDSCRQDCRRSGDGDRKGNRYCFMPCDFTIIVPVPGQDQPGPEESALPSPDPRCAPFHCDPKPSAMFPPNPAKIAELIQAFAAGVGKSAGDLAGAIAAFPPALLL